MKRTLISRFAPLSYPLGNGVLTTGSKDLKPMFASNDTYYDPPKLRKRLDDDGYLLFKNIIPKNLIDKAFEDVANQLIANNWLNESDMKKFSDRDGFVLDLPFPESGKLPPAKAGFKMTTNISDAIGGSNVMTVMRQILSGGVELLPRKELELATPGESFGLHMDNPFQNRGTRLVLTAWVPLHTTTLSHGPMCVVRGSNSHDSYTGIRNSYGVYDIEAGDIHGDGTFTSFPSELSALSTETITIPDTGVEKVQNSCPFVTCSFDPGDVVVTTCYTMHGFLTNTSPFWRISGETKWIMEGDDVGPDPRYVPAPGTTVSPGLAKWEETQDDKSVRPRSMNDAKRDWGLVAGEGSSQQKKKHGAEEEGEVKEAAGDAKQSE